MTAAERAALERARDAIAELTRLLESRDGERDEGDAALDELLEKAGWERAR